jgi:undecaprenyl-diphosphatase
MIEQINIALFQLINQYAGINPIFDSIAVLAAEYMPVVVILFMVYLWIRKGDRTHDILLYSVYAAIVGLIINYLIGLIYFHPRPSMLHLGTQLFPYPTDSSFPSDHTTLMVSIALMLIYFKETRVYGMIILIFGLIGGFARVFSGIHFPFDIFGSVVVAIISSVLIFHFKERFNSLNNLIKQIYSRITDWGR